MNFYGVYFKGLHYSITIFADSFRVAMDSYGDSDVLFAIFKVNSVIVAIIPVHEVEKITKDRKIVWTKFI